jgi:hypothetical protein
VLDIVTEGTSLQWKQDKKKAANIAQPFSLSLKLETETKRETCDFCKANIENELHPKFETCGETRGGRGYP